MKPDSTLPTALAVLSLFLLTACAPDPESDADAPLTYVHSMDGAPTSLDPAQASTIYANTLVVNLFDTLYRYQYLSRPYELAPNLADGMPRFSDDGLTLTIRIKPGVRFIDDPAFEGGRLRDVFPAMQDAARGAVARLAPIADGREIEMEFEGSHAAADVIFRTLFSVPIETGAED